MAEQVIDIGTQGEGFSQGIITFPGAGGDLVPLGIGATFLDLLAGQVTMYDTGSSTPSPNPGLSASLKALGASYATSMLLWSDVDLNFKLRLAGSFSQLINYQQASYPQYALPFDGIELDLTEAGDVFFQAFVDESPTNIFAPASFQTRYSAGTTVAAQTALNWQAANLSGALSDSGASYVLGTIRTRQFKTKAFVIFNTDAANSLKANLQGQAYPDTNFADDASTGTSITVSAGNSATLAVNALYFNMRLRLQDATGGSHAKYVVQYVGTTS